MDKELRVLIVEDSAADAELSTKELGKDGLVHTSKLVKSKDEFLKALGEYTPDIILCDYKMPGFGAPEALEIAKKISPEIPFVVVSGAIGEDVAVEMLKSGAVDYVMKGNISRLAPVVTRALKETEERAESKRAKEKLSYFRKAVDSATDAIGMSTPEGRHYYQNEAFTKMFGLSVKETDGASGPPSSIYSDKKVGRKVFDAIMRGDSFTGEVKMLAEDKSEKDILLRAYSIKDEKGKVIGLVGIHTDITERKKLEDALKNSEANFRAIFDHANDGIILADEETKKFYIGNNTASQMLGYSLEEIKNLGVTDIHPKEDLPYVLGEFEKQVRREIAVAKDLPVKRKDGTVFYADVNTSLVTLDGKMYLVGIFRDITERKRAEEELRGSKKMLEDISQGIGDGVLLLSKDLRILWANNAALKQIGCKTKEIIGDYCYRITHKRESPCQPPDDVCPIGEVGKVGELVGAIHTHVNQAGDKLFVEVIAYPVVNEKGEVVQFVHLTRDITERKKMEEVAKKRLYELEVFYKAAVGREERILELKKEVESLKKELGK